MPKKEENSFVHTWFNLAIQYNINWLLIYTANTKQQLNNKMCVHFYIFTLLYIIYAYNYI